MDAGDVGEEGEGREVAVGDFEAFVGGGGGGVVVWQDVVVVG